MTTISLPPAPQNLGNTPSRRIPLGIVSNGGNSPFRGATVKRSHDQLEAHDQFPWDLKPPAKRHATETERSFRPNSPKRQVIQHAEARVFNQKSNNGCPTAFERQLLAAKEHKSQQRIERQEKGSQPSAKGIRQWQEHYKRAFPLFVFYFEGIPEDIRIRCSKYARSLGAREEKFFSKDVTHVVTTRAIPAETDTVEVPTNPNNVQDPLRHRTINPSLLETSGDQTHSTTGLKGKFTFETPTIKRQHLTSMREVESKRPSAGNIDILLKAKEMGMKVWQLEKFQRMIRTMLEIPEEAQPQVLQASKNKISTSTNKPGREAELSRMLRNERLNGPSDRDPTVALSELVPFKGPYLYVRDMDERTKPILLRDYQKPAKGEIGDWPQFHGVRAGRCAFIPDPSQDDADDSREAEQEKAVPKPSQVRSAPMGRASTYQTTGTTASTVDVPKRPALRETKTAENEIRLPRQSPEKIPSRDFCPPPSAFLSRKQDGNLKSQTNMSHLSSRLIDREPAASGVQPSNITSAIRSQMISSTAAAPGAKAGTSKEVHGLQRKVLQKNVAPVLSKSHVRSAALDPAAVARAERAMPSKQSRGQAHNVVIHQDENLTQSEEEDVWLAEDVRRSEAIKKKRSSTKSSKRSGRPGYCENCQDKYDDFDEHITSRKHRKFALTNDHWKDLDRLLTQLGRRVKEPEDEGF